MDFGRCQARALGRRHLEVQQGGREGEHTGDEAVGGLGEKQEEKVFISFFLLFSTAGDERRRRGKRKPDLNLSLSLFSKQTLIYAGQTMDNDRTLASYGVPRVRFEGRREKRREERETEARYFRNAARSLSHLFFVFFLFYFDPLPSLTTLHQGCQALVAIETARLSNPPDPDSPFWN